jgi:hypothetical protein
MQLCVEIVGLLMRAIYCSKSVGVGLDVSKLGFVCGMFVWVHDSSIAYG